MSPRLLHHNEQSYIVRLTTLIMDHGGHTIRHYLVSVIMTDIKHTTVLYPSNRRNKQHKIQYTSFLSIIYFVRN